MSDMAAGRPGQLPAFRWGDSDRGTGKCAHAFWLRPAQLLRRPSLCGAVTSGAWPPPRPDLRRCAHCLRFAAFEREQWCRETSLRSTGRMPTAAEMQDLLARLDRLTAFQLA